MAGTIELMTPGEVIRALRLDVVTDAQGVERPAKAPMQRLAGLRRRGLLRCVKFGAGVMFRREDVRQMVDSHVRGR